MKKKDALDSLFENIKTKEEFQTLMDQLYKRGVETMLRSEMSHHLGYSPNENKPQGIDNSRNGYSKKTLKTIAGEVEIDIPRDRNGEFSPIIVPKHQRMTDHLDDVIIKLYAKGMSTTDIEMFIKETYGVEISAATVSNITNELIEDIKLWQNRALDQQYPVIWLDAIHYKVNQSHRVVNKALYIAVGLNINGLKEVLGLWMGSEKENAESASFWTAVLNDLKSRGVSSVYIFCTDNLPGLTKAINAVYPNTWCQLCIVHQIRNTMKYVSFKDRKLLAQDLKLIYTAINSDQAWDALQVCIEKWKSKYRYAFQSWETNWDNLTIFLKFPVEIRKMIYTTNVIESLNSSIRKYTRNKSVFPNESAVLKSVYFALQQISNKWTMTVHNWGSIYNQLLILNDEKKI